MVLAVKNLPAHAGDVRDTGSSPSLGRSLGGGNGNPLQCSCLEHPRDRGAWRAMVCRVSKSRKQLKQLGRQARTQRQCLEATWWQAEVRGMVR